MNIRVKHAALFLFLASVLTAADPNLDQARKLYDLTDFDQSIRLLQALPDKDASVYALLGRNYFMLSDYKKATDLLEKAYAADPHNAEFALWLGRAYGRRAETSSPFTAPGYASKTRQFLEKSVQLNPHDIEALNDLFEYYLEAPGFLGGGLDKAQAISQKIAAVNPSEGHWAQAKIAERRKEFSTAEEQLKRAIELAPHQVGRLIDLARFLVKQGRVQEADQSLAKADKIAPNSPKLMFAKAELYIRTGRNLDEAKALLQRYLTCTLTPEDPPRADAQKLLRKVQGS